MLKQGSTTQQAFAPSSSSGFQAAEPAPWVLVAGGFHLNGGMDKANLALAQYLVGQGARVHLVCHSVDPDFARNPRVTVHQVSRPAGSFFLGKPLLDWRGRKVARQVQRQWPDSQVVVNGDNCLWPGINWIHYVHHAWDPGIQAGPLWFRVKQMLNRWLVRKREKAAARVGRLFITNSDRTTRDMIQLLGVEAERVRTVYLGAETEWGQVTESEKASSRQAFQISADKLVAVYVGSLGLDRRKGFDTLLEAWKRLCADPNWDVDLLVAGSGNALEACRRQVSQWNLEGRVRILGFSKRVQDLLACADVLVSPVRYEAYGLNVQEAICRGIPSIISASAGVAERYAPEDRPLLLSDPEDVDALVETVRMWRANREAWSLRFREFGEQLRQYGWNDMAQRMVALAGSSKA